MRILFDTNVVLDALQHRPPHTAPAIRLLAAVEENALTGALCATSVTTVHYFLRKSLGDEEARARISKLLNLFEVASVSRPTLESALTTGIKDFEDAVLHEAARLADADGIVTRNGSDYAAGSLRIYTPQELLAMLRLRGEESLDEPQ